MSDHLYPRRLFYSADYGGSVVVGAIYRTLTLPPHVPGLPEFDFIDYAGIFYTPEIRPLFEKRREMFDAEVRAVEAWLSVQQADPVRQSVDRRFTGENT